MQLLGERVVIQDSMVTRRMHRACTRECGGLASGVKTKMSPVHSPKVVFPVTSSANLPSLEDYSMAGGRQSRVCSQIGLLALSSMLGGSHPEGATNVARRVFQVGGRGLARSPHGRYATACSLGVE